MLNEELSLGDVLEKGYVTATAFQEAENADMMEALAKHLSLYNSDIGQAQVLKYNGFYENDEGDLLIAPTDLVEMWNEETKETWMNNLFTKGINELKQDRRMLVACFAFGKERISADGIKYLDPWKGHQIRIEECYDLLGFANDCFWNYLAYLSQDISTTIKALDPQPLALAYHWQTKDENGIEECPHVHLLFSVKKVISQSI